MLEAHEEMIFIEKGQNKAFEQIPYNKETNIRTWSEYVWRTLAKRKIEIINTMQIKNIITTNKTVIDYVEECIQEKHEKPIVLQQINLVRLYKKIYLPIELVGIKGDK